MGRRAGSDNALEARNFFGPANISVAKVGLESGQRVVGITSSGDTAAITMRVGDIPGVELDQEGFNAIVNLLLSQQPERFPTIVAKIAKHGSHIQLTDDEIETVRVAVYKYLTEKGAYCPDVLPNKYGQDSFCS